MNKARVSRKLKNQVQRLNHAYRVVRHLTVVYTQDVFKELEGEPSSSQLGVLPLGGWCLSCLTFIRASSWAILWCHLPLPSVQLARTQITVFRRKQMSVFFELMVLLWLFLVPQMWMRLCTAPTWSPHHCRRVGQWWPYVRSNPWRRRRFLQPFRILRRKLAMAKYTCAIHVSTLAHYRAQTQECDKYVCEYKEHKSRFGVPGAALPDGAGSLA